MARMFERGSGDLVTSIHTYIHTYIHTHIHTHTHPGGSGANEARIFERESGDLVGSIKGMKQGVYSVDFHPQLPQVAVASGDGTVRVVNYAK